MNTFKILLLYICCSCLIPITNGQVNKQETKGFTSLSSDYFYENGVRYLMDHSPLSVFSDYKKLFPEISLKEVTYASIGYGPLLQDKNYVVVWKLVNDSLYLSDISFLVGAEKEWANNLDRDLAYDRLSVMVKSDFDTLSNISQIAPVSYKGVILASWVTDTLYVKPVRPTYTKDMLNEEEAGPAWLAVPYERLIFKDGVLVSRTRLNGKKISAAPQRLKLNSAEPNPGNPFKK